MEKIIIFFIGVSSFAKKMGVGLKSIFIVFFLLLPLTSQAAVIEFSDFKSEIGPRGVAVSYTYNLVFKSINPTSTVPIPCTYVCTVKAQLYNGGWVDPSGGPAFKTVVRGVSTVGELEQKLSGLVGTSILTWSSAEGYHGIKPNACISLTYLSPDSSDPYRYLTVPGSPCSPLPLTNTVCKFDNTPSISYGVVNSNNIEGNKKSADLNIGCSGDTTVDFTLNNSSIDLSGGIVSKLSISKEKADIKAGDPSVVTITSVLHSSGKAEAGNHVNSAILYATWQ
ncbi:TPA: hypothetical protein JG919_003846 [Enterobacter hormaechei subsp. steigerwaltii]|nr:hypothetical protein [Enterobacter hormaechei subsp. steigerwaltii]